MSSDGDDQRIFLGVKFSILGFLRGGKIWQVFFGGGLIYVGIIWRIFVLFWKFLRLRNSAWDFLRVNFWPRDFWGFCWNP